MHRDLTTIASELATSCAVTAGHRDCGLLKALEQDERALLRHARAASARVAAGESLPPVSAWLLDNYAYLDAQIRDVREAMPRGYYRYLPRMADGRYRGEPRVWQLASEVLAQAGAALSIETLRDFFLAYQEVAVLSLAELWAIAPMLRLALIRTIARAAEDPAGAEDAVRDALFALRLLEVAPWRDFVESISAVDAVLNEDPAGVYAGMEFETRDAYRHAVEGFARASRRAETEIAALAVAMAREPDANPHVGYYLAGRGAALLKKRAECRTPLAARVRGWAYACPNAVYLGGVLLALALLLWGFRAALAAPWWALALLVLPASQAAIAAANPIIHLLFPPRRLPRMDFSEGIPADCRTFVVVPTLLLSRAGAENLLNNLEIHYLANRDPNLLLALLTDFPDSRSPVEPRDGLLDLVVEGIHALNDRHNSAGRAPFYLFHRKRDWNESEGVWMGYERKRGKLDDFNLFLLGREDHFDVKAGDLKAIGDIRYVITLDSDTQLPRDTARKLVAAMAHPLNRPVFDEATGAVREGYALMQPRISISMESAGRSRLARIFSVQTGFDPYTTAVSDVYQDLHSRASFTGKGIYDLRAFHRALDGRFPENALLSHDLIEGEHTGVGLVTDLEMIDDYPASHEAWSKRKHRWVRGDWQILPWLLPRVPGPGGRRRNSLGLLARWKIFDNLRRSLLEVSLVGLLAAAWFALGNPGAWTLAVVACLVLPAYLELVLACVRVPPARFWDQYFREVAWRFGRAHAEALLQVVFLAQQACLMADAVARTLVRRFITHRRLLEWESAAQAEASSGRGMSLPSVYLLASPAIALAAALAMPQAAAAASLPLLVLETWIFAPLAARWLNARPRLPRAAAASDSAFLRDAALRTWRYFADYCREEDSWLIPDNVQEDPPAAAHRASPTNIGLLATAHLAANDFGYLTTTEMASRLERVLRSMSRLERCRGHFYNWYDTRSLETLEPLFVSTVDSGNLAASLLTLRQGCLERLGRPALEWSTLAGLRDHALRLRDALPDSARSAPVMRLLSALLRQLEYRPTDLFFWESVLTEASHLVRRLADHVEWECRRLEEEEVRYWHGALAARMDRAMEELYAIAPWLAPPFEMELRQFSCAGSLAGVVAELARVGPLGELPAQYDAAARAIRERLDAPQPLPRGLRQTLEQVLALLIPARARVEELVERLEEHAAVAAGFVQEMDFAFLFDARRKLLRIGYDARAERLEEGYYDLLASEARTAVFLGIAKGDLPREAWFHLGRKLTAWRGCRTLLSWSGTMFEYLMPCIFMETYARTLLGESLREVVRIQQRYGRERGAPWGISESASSARDSTLCYQYEAFGIPHLGMKRRRSQDLVIAPYATMLALMVDRGAATANLRAMADRGWLTRHGFYEAVDFTRGCTVVRSFMAHHQGMALMALANVLHDGVMRKRFHAEPPVQATEYLLQERAPALVEVRATVSLSLPAEEKRAEHAG